MILELILGIEMNEHLVNHTPFILAMAMRHPITGAITSLSLSASGYLVPGIVIEMQFPLIIMQSIQILVWGLAAIASYLTIKGYFKKKGNG